MSKSKQPRNLARSEHSLSGEHIAWLNEQSPGLGNLLHQVLTDHGQSLSAQAGYKGTVGIALPKAKDSKGELEDSMNLSGGRIGGAADATRDDQYVPLRQVRRLIPGIEEGNLDTPFGASDVCKPVSLSNQLKAITGCTAVYAVEIQNEFIYVAGEDAGAPLFEVYRLNHSSNSMTLVGSLTHTEIFTRMSFQGHFIYGTGAASSNLTIIDVQKPNAPIETVGSPFAIGATTHGNHAQGRYLFVACDGAVLVIDVSLPGAPDVLTGAI